MREERREQRGPADPWGRRCPQQRPLEQAAAWWLSGRHKEKEAVTAAQQLELNTQAAPSWRSCSRSENNSNKNNNNLNDTNNLVLQLRYVDFLSVVGGFTPR